MSDMQRDDALDLNPMDHISRARWSVALASILCQQPLEALQLMVQHGEAEFIRICKPIIGGHGFKQEDYLRIFKIVRRCVELNRQPTMQEIVEVTH